MIRVTGPGAWRGNCIAQEQCAGTDEAERGNAKRIFWPCTRRFSDSGKVALIAQLTFLYRQLHFLSSY